jgi:hypothetical protein
MLERKSGVVELGGQIAVTGMAGTGATKPLARVSAKDRNPHPEPTYRRV